MNDNKTSDSCQPYNVVRQILPQQFANIPLTAFSGFTSKNAGALSPAVIQSLSSEQIAAFQQEELKQIESNDMAKFLTNTTAEALTAQQAEKLLPTGWTLDNNGNLHAPPGSTIALKSVKQSNELPAGLTLPNIADLNSSFALHGKGTQPLLSQLNTIGEKNGFSLAQQNLGVVHGFTSAEVPMKKKKRFAFMIDPSYLFILSEEALKGLHINEQGQYILVTDDGKEIPITPMTQDPEGLLTILGKDAELDIQPTGEVLLKYNRNKRSRDGEAVHSVGMFDPFIEPAPEDVCSTDDAGNTTCNWDKADAAAQPGLRAARETRATAAAKIIYPDGTSQKLYPAVLSPLTLVALAQKMAGVEKVVFRMDGTFAVTYQGTSLLLLPLFDTQVQDIPPGQVIEPSLILQSGGILEYHVAYRQQLFTTHLSIQAVSP